MVRAKGGIQVQGERGRLRDVVEPSGTELDT